MARATNVKLIVAKPIYYCIQKGSDFGLLKKKKIQLLVHKENIILLYPLSLHGSREANIYIRMRLQSVPYGVRSVHSFLISSLVFAI